MARRVTLNSSIEYARSFQQDFSVAKKERKKERKKEKPEVLEELKFKSTRLLLSQWRCNRHGVNYN